jgi:hypothetical protein
MDSRAACGDVFSNVVYASDSLQAVLLITAALVAASIVLPLITDNKP